MYKSQIKSINLNTLLKTVKPARGWTNKIANLDELMSWLYDNHFTKTDQQTKDKLFRSYYRYYNDGDIPKRLRYEDPQVIEAILEYEVGSFIRYALKKYHSRYSRQEFYTKKKLEKLSYMKRHTEDTIPTTYFFTVKNYFNNPAYDMLTAKYVTLYHTLSDKIKSLLQQESVINIFKDKETTYFLKGNGTINYFKDAFVEENVWTDEFEKIYQEMIETNGLIADEVQKMIEDTQTKLASLKF